MFKLGFMYNVYSRGRCRDGEEGEDGEFNATPVEYIRRVVML
jgi:hypothetical protein